MSSRRIEDLTEEVQKAAREHLLLCADEGIDLLIYCTLRDVREQAQLWRRGRTMAQVQRKIDLLAKQGFEKLSRILDEVGPQFGPKVTFAGPGDSFHQYRLAYDCVPLLNGRAVWSTSGAAGEMWQKVGALGKKAGMEWAGDWKRFREFPHFQMTGGKTVKALKQARFGKAPAPVAMAAPAFGRRRGLAAAAPAAAPMAAVAGDQDATLRAALAEANTVFMVFASGAGADDTDVGATFDLATRVAESFNPELWRTFWVRQPGDLGQELEDLLWDGGDPSPAVLLGLGTGLDRDRVQTYQLKQLGTAFDVADAFNQG